MCIIALATKSKKTKLVKYKITKIFIVISELYLRDKSLCRKLEAEHLPTALCSPAGILGSHLPVGPGSALRFPSLLPSAPPHSLSPACSALPHSGPLLQHPQDLSLPPAPALSRLLSSSSS